MAPARTTGRRRVVTVAVTLAVTSGLLLAWAFQPWRLVTDRVVDDALPVVTTPTAPTQPTTGQPTTDQPSGPVDLAAGELVTHEHDTSGTVRLLELPDGSRVLRVEGLVTTDGPDLRVWLSDAPVVQGRDGWFVFDDGEYLDLGPLKGNVGDANYPVPVKADLQSLTSVSIWCRRFSVSFGAAALT